MVRQKINGTASHLFILFDDDRSRGKNLVVFSKCQSLSIKIHVLQINHKKYSGFNDPYISEAHYYINVLKEMVILYRTLLDNKYKTRADTNVPRYCSY